MPPPLHPRSRLTSSLFATTLFACFFVVALPHILPCPAPRLAYADGEMPDGTQQRRRRRRRKIVEKDAEQTGSSIGCRDTEDNSDEGSMVLSKSPMPKRECPLPKPGGLVGEILGLKPPSTGRDGKGRPPWSYIYIGGYDCTYCMNWMVHLSVEGHRHLIWMSSCLQIEMRIWRQWGIVVKKYSVSLYFGFSVVPRFIAVWWHDNWVHEAHQSIRREVRGE